MRRASIAVALLSASVIGSATAQADTAADTNFAVFLVDHGVTNVTVEKALSIAHHICGVLYGGQHVGRWLEHEVAADGNAGFGDNWRGLVGPTINNHGDIMEFLWKTLPMSS